jgi:hypothetical protein
VELSGQEGGDADADRVPPPRRAKPLAVTDHLHRLDSALRAESSPALSLAAMPVATWL